MQTDIIDFKLYKKIENRVAANSCHKKLIILATNITRYVKLKKVHSVYLNLAKRAINKANSTCVLNKYSPPINSAMQEAVAFNMFVSAAVIANKIPSTQVVKQKEDISYAKILANQVSCNVTSPTFKTLRDQGLVHITAQYFVYHYAGQLVTPKVYAQVKNLFQTKPQILFPSSVALAA